ncbi:hypothetical protein GCM10023086_10840 [Streptomyces venetus]|uniref:DUF1737 domain-containing protein n=1 Tax=Streptomyces venetus TaxID=1701086 RepID=A0ABP8F7H0_9ACTN
MTLYEIVYGPRPGKNTDFPTLLRRALDANATLARGYALVGDATNEAAMHREINKLLGIWELDRGAA